MIGMKITADSFLDNKELREEVKDRIEVLEKVKQLILIPDLDCMTVKQVAEYFEVDVETIQKQYQRNKDEFDSDGAYTKSLAEFKNLNWTSCPIKNTAQLNGKFVIYFEDGTKLIIPNRGMKCFPVAAILRMGMVLQGSAVAKEIRNRLVDLYRNTPREERTETIVRTIDEEVSLTNAIGATFATGDMMKFAEACMSLDSYRKRYITEMEQHNAELTQKNT